MAEAGADFDKWPYKYGALNRRDYGLQKIHQLLVITFSMALYPWRAAVSTIRSVASCQTARGR